MPIFIPVFIVLFIIVPVILTRLAAPMLGVRTLSGWFLLFMVITALNWQMWQAPRLPAGPVAPRAQALAP